MKTSAWIGVRTNGDAGQTDLCRYSPIQYRRHRRGGPFLSLPRTRSRLFSQTLENPLLKQGDEVEGGTPLHLVVHFRMRKIWRSSSPSPRFSWFSLCRDVGGHQIFLPSGWRSEERRFFPTEWARGWGEDCRRAIAIAAVAVVGHMLRNLRRFPDQQ